MNQTEILSVLRDLHEITGFRVSLHDASFEEIAAYPIQPSAFCRRVHAVPGERLQCLACDRAKAGEALRRGEACTYRCRFGMIEAASPLYSFGILTGFLMMGQVREDTPAAERECENLCRGIFPDRDERIALIRSVATVPTKRIEPYVHIMTVCAEYLTLSDALAVPSPGIAVLAKKYIGENFARKINLTEVSRALCCSKSTLMGTFRRTWGMTVNDYLNEVRLTRACSYLTEGEKSMGEIARTCGFSDQSYFSKVFCARYGCSPSEYRKKENHENSAHR